MTMVQVQVGDPSLSSPLSLYAHLHRHPTNAQYVLTLLSPFFTVNKPIQILPFHLLFVLLEWECTWLG